MKPDIAELRRLEAEASEGPWRIELGRLGTLISDGQDAVAETYDEVDAALIVAMRNHAKAMIEAIEQSEQRLAMLRRVEWSAAKGCDDRCPACRRENTEGHAPDCELAQSLKGNQ